MRALITCCTLTLLLLPGAIVKGQDLAAIEGTIKDSTLQTLPFTSVSLYHIPDSSLVKGSVSDEVGNFAIRNFKAGDYQFVIYLVGYKKYQSAAFHLNAGEKKNVGEVHLSSAAMELKTVEVVVQKPFIEHFADKTVVNVENSIVSVGNSVYEVLERVPGVSFDQNGNISLRGKEGVNVMIDGKSVQMSAEQLENYLKGMSSSTIEKIELITNPSAKYDAAGSAGIINIKTKNGRKNGLNGSIYSNYSQGHYGKSNAGFSLNAKYKKMNWFGNYDYGYKTEYYDLALDRTFSTNGNPNLRYVQNNFVLFPFKVHTGKVGVDYYLSSKTTIGAVFSGSSNSFHTNGNSSSRALNGANDLQYYYNTSNYSNEMRQNGSANLNLKREIDTTGKELRMDLDYAVYNNPIGQNFTSSYLDLNGKPFLPVSLVRTDVQASLNIYSAKLDYSHPFSTSLKLEAGFKSSYVTADNDKHFYNTSNGTESVDSGKTNHFLYDENINAVYASLNKDFKKLNVQVGLRGEQTTIHGNQVTSHIRFERTYAQLFPTAFILYRLNEKNEISFNYSQRIDRPNYQSLNPFIIYVDPTFYKQGNPYLLPELSNSFELGYTVRQNISANIYFTRTRNNIGVVLLQDDINKITIQTEQNMNHVDYAGGSVNGSFKVTKWWTSYNDLNLYYGRYTGSQQGETYNRSNVVLSVNSTNSFILPKDFTGELSFFYKTKEVYGLLDMNSFSSLNLGMKKTFFDKKLIAKLSGTDVLFGKITSGSINFHSINETFVRKSDSRFITISLIYTIGKDSGSGSKRRSGAEDEKKRAGATGG